MNSQQILLALRGQVNYNVVNFIGCLPSNEVAHLDLSHYHKDGKPIVFIANVLSSEQLHVMGHWVVFYIKGKCIYFFDSYALKPRLYSKHFGHFFNNHEGYTILKHKFRLQSDDSLVCGVYCIQFVYLVSQRGIIKTCEYLRNIYHKNNYVMNDRKVLRFAYKTFIMPPCAKTFSKKTNKFGYDIQILPAAVLRLRKEEEKKNTPVAPSLQ